MGPQVGGDPDGADQEVGAAGAVVGVRVEQGGAVLAARVEHVAGARLHRDAQPERVQPAGDPAGAVRQVVAERVEMHVVQRQADAVVAEVGEEAEGVVEPEVGEAVGAVAEAEGGRRGGVRGVAHVMLTFLMAALLANIRPAGARAAISRDVAGAPARAARAAWRGIVARMPPPTARWVSGGEGLSVAWK